MTPASREAMHDAYGLAQMLPPDVAWSVMLTHDTASDCPAAFNVFVRDDAERGAMRQLLKLGNPSWEDDGAEQHEYTSRITLSIIEETRP